MLQQDYIMRLIREFFAALQRALEKPEIEDRTQAVHQLYERYLGEYEFYQNATVEEALEAIADYPEEQRLYRVEILAELYYAEAGLRATPIGETLMRRALPLFEYVDLHSKIYSFDRKRKMEEIRRFINTPQQADR